ncbi:hypothetical protein [Paenibacillus odorifer]|uniref:hypothetical protein n=1 Tax=Paenibacillus TaxID=44249 RepID=UPI00096C62D6|nr:hypothetical protein [Paenibacillus odorifer]OME34085.1 hypothetical protein BSK63_09800 [Paenibacillus odorifer]OME38868.1 hypothetical protein BSK46_11910 [Paenibacillus odorifer]
MEKVWRWLEADGEDGADGGRWSRWSEWGQMELMELMEQMGWMEAVGNLLRKYRWTLIASHPPSMLRPHLLSTAHWAFSPLPHLVHSISFSPTDPLHFLQSN